ncbi:MAG: hypothetical protein GX181_09910 [Synergistaceae bacterium]|nr:hypothetical protein [Synergistota bacterium]NLM72254.1 hypothetical protein [Synergistaceae bacterium]
MNVENTYSAISESNGKGIFFVHSDKAAKDPEFAEKLLERMRSGPIIDGVSPNEVQRAVSVPGDTSKFTITDRKRRCT